MKIILTSIFFFITFCTFSSTDSTNQVVDFIKSDYRLQFPKSWTIDTSGTMYTELIVYSANEDENDKFRENINVIVQDLSDTKIDLEKYAKISEEQIKVMATDGEIFESTKVSINNATFYKLIYAMTQGVFRLKITSYCFIKNDKAYLITFTSELNKFEKFSEISSRILNSFKLTDN